MCISQEYKSHENAEPLGWMVNSEVKKESIDKY